MSLSDIVDIQVTSETPGVEQAGFGVPLILGAHTHYTDRIRFYGSLTELVQDGFLTTEPEYRAASALFAQNPRPPTIAVGRRANRPTIRWALTPTVANATRYAAKVNGVEVGYTSDATATAAEIIAGLTAAITPLATGLVLSDQTTYLRATGAAAGSFYTVESTTPDVLAVGMDHAASDPAGDLSAIALVDSSWYAIVSLFNSPAEITAIATWAEANEKLFVASTQDTAILGAGTTDIASVLKAAGWARTAPIYHPDNGSFAGAAWLGACLPFDPGSETWKFKTLAGVAATNLTATQRTNLRNKNCNFYYTVGGSNMTADGVVSVGEFIDIIRGRDWMKARTAERVFGVIKAQKKVPYTDAGVAAIEGELRAQVQDGIEAGFLRADPAPTFSIPKVASISTQNRADRLLPDLAWSAEAAGAIHKLVIRGNVRV